MSTFDKLSGLPLEIESYDLEPLERDVSSDFTRLSTVIRLRGGGHEGVGEDVTYDALDHVALQEAGPNLPLAGAWTIDSFTAKIAELDLFPAEPVRDVSRLYRRWAYDSAALDLALRQAGISLGEALGRDVSPGDVRGVAAARKAGESRPRAAAARCLPDPPLQARPDERVDRGADRGPRRHGRGRLRRLQGPLQGDGGRPAARPGSLPTRRRGLPGCVDRGSGADRRDAPDPRRRRRTASPGTRRSTRSPTSRRCRSRRRW